MNHPFDDNNLTFSDLRNIFINGLAGKLNREDKVSEKLGIWIEKTMYGKKYFGTSRSTFIVDSKGRIFASKMNNLEKKCPLTGRFLDDHYSYQPRSSSGT